MEQFKCYRKNNYSEEYYAYVYDDKYILPFVHHTNDGKPFVYWVGDNEGDECFFMEFINLGDIIVESKCYYSGGKVYEVYHPLMFEGRFTKDRPENPAVKMVDSISGPLADIVAKMSHLNCRCGFNYPAIPVITVTGSINPDASGGFYFPEDPKPKKPSWLRRLWSFIKNTKKLKKLYIFTTQ